MEAMIARFYPFSVNQPNPDERHGYVWHGGRWHKLGSPYRSYSNAYYRSSTHDPYLYGQLWPGKLVTTGRKAPRRAYEELPRYLYCHYIATPDADH